MQISKLAKTISKYLPVLAVLAAPLIGALMGNVLYPPSRASQATTPVQFATEPKDPQLLPLLGAGDLCFSSYIYTSLPPKCKTAEGAFVPIPGTSTNIFVIPERK